MKRKNFVAVITTANSGGKIFAPKINVRIPELDITSSDFKHRYEDSLYVFGDNKEEAREKAESLLANLNTMLNLFKEQNQGLIGK